MEEFKDLVKILVIFLDWIVGGGRELYILVIMVMWELGERIFLMIDLFKCDF